MGLGWDLGGQLVEQVFLEMTNVESWVQVEKEYMIWIYKERGLEYPIGYTNLPLSGPHNLWVTIVFKLKTNGMLWL